MRNKIILVLLLLILPAAAMPQYINNKHDNFKISGLTGNYFKDSTDNINTDININKKHNPALSLILSVLVPGAGHYYADRMDVGKYFLGAEISLWVGLFGVNYYGNVIKDDARSYAKLHSGYDPNGKDDNFFANLGTFMNVYDYNNKKLQEGDYSAVYNTSTHFWNWDNAGNMEDYNIQRKRGERTHNLRSLFITGMIVNRVISGISALILTNKGNKGDINVTSELTSLPGQGFDGFRINFIKSF